MSRAADSEAELVLRLEIGDPTLRERMAELLSGVAGLRLARAGEPADVVVQGTPVDRDDVASPDLELTPRETEVLRLLAEGASNKTIAVMLGISVHTAKFHVGQLLDKLDATGRTDAVAHAARIGILTL